jgi:S-formylglutathione hydrolase FrmB
MMRPALAALLLAACSSSSPPPGTPPTAVAPVPAAGHGTVVTEEVASAALGVTKSVVVYLPAGYAADPARRWPVYYFLHGLGGDETNWTKHGELDKVADRASVQAIIVMPDGDNSFYTDSVTPMDYEACLKDGTGLFNPAQSAKENCVKTPRYETWITKDLVTWTDSTYRTIAKRESRAIAGLSMGGFGALELGLRHKDLYVAAVSHSGVDALLYAGPFPYVAGKVELVNKVPAEAGDMFVKWLKVLFGNDIANWRAHDPATLVGDLKPGELALYMDCGTEDVFHLNNGMQYLHELLLAKNIDHAYFMGPGRHDFSFWTPRLPESLKFLAAHVAAK